MSKRITSISLDNCRAYYGNYDKVILPFGQNLLIYGENGSGKSSMFKALNNYFQSSNNIHLPYVKNRHQTTQDGIIDIGFSDFDASGEIVIGSEVNYVFGSAFSNNNVSFIQDAARIKGFLDYTDLLKVYLHTEPRPNLFELIVLVLLGDHTPVSSGGSYQFGKKWKQLQDHLTNARTRKDRLHQIALRDLAPFETQLNHTLTLVFTEMNRLLSTYFSDMNIELDYDLQPLVFNYGNKGEWHTTSDLRLSIYKDGIVITGGYSDYLNEARLSAIAICLYLSSLLQNPSTIDLRVLYLDDVFIGLDAGNRLPILNILQHEFSAYQIFISTYDRHWFELAKRHFDINSVSDWLNLEIYVGQDIIGTTSISKPIIVTGESNYVKAIQYLHNRIKPDYPASANYFRKALEEIIPKYIPGYELVNEEKIQLADFKLTSILYRAKYFLERANNDSSEINKIISVLNVLLHPLSHHEISSPVYKAELLMLEENIAKLENRLKGMDTANNFQCALDPYLKLKLSFIIDNTINYFIYYEIVLKEPAVLQMVSGGSTILLKTKCYTERAYGINNGVPLVESKPNKANPLFNYLSIEDAVEKIYTYLIGFTGVNFPKPINYFDIVQYHDGADWKPVTDKLIWK